MRKLSIVHTEASLGWGGQEIRILSESQGMIRRGHEVRLLCPPEARIYAEAPSYGVPAVVWDASSKGAQAYAALADEVLEREGVQP